MRGSGLPTASYVAIERAQLRLALDALKAADTPAADLGSREVRHLLSKSGDGANLRARFGALSRFLDWCQDADYITVNPCTMIARSRRRRAPRARSDLLTPGELARLWRAAAGLHEPVYRDLARFLMAIPCRRGEAARMRWEHLDLVAAEWREPGHLTKNRDPHRLHLHPLVLDVLRARHRTLAEEQVRDDPRKIDRVMQAGWPRTGLVFAAPRSGKSIDTFSGLKEALVHASEADGAEALAGWLWHDFRRSFATALGEAGIPEAVADAVLNHRQAATRGGVLGVYQRASRWPEQVRAMTFWDNMLAAARHLTWRGSPNRPKPTSRMRAMPGAPWRG